MVKYVTSVSEFDEELKAAGSKLVVVDFTATWCGPCKMIGPIFDRLSGEYTDVVFLKVDVDEVDELSSRCGIQAMPTFQFYKNGEKILEFSGASEQKLKENLDKLK